jgi:transcriptional regulator with XRE-family HTH domain
MNGFCPWKNEIATAFLTGSVPVAALPNRYCDKFALGGCGVHTRRATVRAMTEIFKRNTPPHTERTVYLAAELAGTDGSAPMSTSSSDYTLGERICKARDASGLSTAQLARRLGIKTSTLQSWESDRSEPRSNKLVLLAGVLNVSPTWLLVGRGTPPVSDVPAVSDLDSMRAALDRVQRQAQALADEITALQERLEGV